MSFGSARGDLKWQIHKVAWDEPRVRRIALVTRSKQ